ncbi:MAG: metallophosphoesterase family protein [bacterium]
MKVLVLSDVHANLEALLAVLQIEYDRLIFLGDFIDFGPNPAECIRLIREHSDIALKGNHDHALAYNMSCKSSEELRSLSQLIREDFTSKKVNKDQVKYLTSLSHSRATFFDNFHFFAAHSGANDMYSYINKDLPDDEFSASFNDIKENFIFTGHTHIPYIRKNKDITVINPGSVGQPRDGDPRASAAIIENNEAKIIRIEYDVEKTIEKINELMNIAEGPKERLVSILRTGKV